MVFGWGTASIVKKVYIQLSYLLPSALAGEYIFLFASVSGSGLQASPVPSPGYMKDLLKLRGLTTMLFLKS